MSAWVVDALIGPLSFGTVEPDTATLDPITRQDPGGREEVRVGHRTYHAVATRVATYTTLGARGSIGWTTVNKRSLAWYAGAFGDWGATASLWPRFGLGAAGRLSVTHYWQRTSVGGTRERSRTWAARAERLSVIATLYF